MFDDYDAALGEVPEPEEERPSLPLVGWEVVVFYDERGRVSPLSGAGRVMALRAFYKGEPIPGGWVPGLFRKWGYKNYPHPLPRELVNWTRATIEIRGEP